LLNVYLIFTFIFIINCRGYGRDDGSVKRLQRPTTASQQYSNGVTNWFKRPQSSVPIQSQSTAAAAAAATAIAAARSEDDGSSFYYIFFHRFVFDVESIRHFCHPFPLSRHPTQSATAAAAATTRQQRIRPKL
jgi:hypothetical protein